jgi:methylphosphotriester-DNA--protein-cysteine methyltransferase
VSFDCVDNRGWPGESDRAQLIATEPPRREALRAVIRDVLTLASHSPDVLLQPGAMESAEESILRAADHALHPASRGLEGKRTNLSQYLSLVRTFDEFLAANAGRTVYSADVAKQLGVSVRTLHNAVLAIRGMSMHRYTRLRRLWSVRQQLVQARQPASIKAIALVNGSGTSANSSRTSASCSAKRRSRRWRRPANPADCRKFGRTPPDRAAGGVSYLGGAVKPAFCAGPRRELCQGSEGRLRRRPLAFRRHFG